MKLLATEDFKDSPSIVSLVSIETSTQFNYFSYIYMKSNVIGILQFSYHNH